MTVRHDRPLLTAHDVFLMREGTHCRLYERLGAHPGEVDGVAGTHFGLWAPNAAQVAVIGDFNGWDPRTSPLAVRWDGSGVWEGFVPGAGAGGRYKYHIVSRRDGYRIDKADPFAFAAEEPPRTASIIWDGRHAWNDAGWMARRADANALAAPMSIYEVHAGSWRRPDGHRLPGYRALAHELADYCRQMGFSHVELMPLMEHPFYGSWGYQCTGFFAPTARYGPPEDFMYMVDHLHRSGIGVILDWVPSHFPDDPHGLAYFDGTHLYEHADPRQGYHPEWHSAIFNYGRNEVRAFLLSSAMCWLDRFHVDGLRVDAVASMLYLDYARREGEWIPNRHGGRENLEAIEFLRLLNQAAYRDHPGVQTFAEESTSWPLVSRPTDVGGLGFGLKWNMGWMHDTLDYLQLDPVHRRHHHDRITFSLWYAFYENFVLPLSHDEVVHGKGSLLSRMPGDDWQRFANLRLLLAYMWAHPGKKLLFMGGEFGQWREWNHDTALDWHLLAHPTHAGVQSLVRDLNALLRAEPALHQRDFVTGGFEWVEVHDADHSVLAFLRLPHAGGRPLLVVCNFTPVPRPGYRVGVPQGGRWHEVLNTDAGIYAGSGCGNLGAVAAEPEGAHGRPHALSLTLPPLSALFLAPE